MRASTFTSSQKEQNTSMEYGIKLPSKDQATSRPKGISLLISDADLPSIHSRMNQGMQSILLQKTSNKTLKLRRESIAEVWERSILRMYGVARQRLRNLLGLPRVLRESNPRQFGPEAEPWHHHEDHAAQGKGEQQPERHFGKREPIFRHRRYP